MPTRVGEKRAVGGERREELHPRIGRELGKAPCRDIAALFAPTEEEDQDSADQENPPTAIAQSHRVGAVSFHGVLKELSGIELVLELLELGPDVDGGLISPFGILRETTLDHPTELRRKLRVDLGDRRSGASLTIADSTEVGFFPLKGSRPVHISNRMTPSEKISVR